MTKLTPEKMTLFCSLIEEGCTVTDAAKGIGIERQTAYAWRDNNAEFARAWASAVQARDEALELVARQRAKGGSDTLLIFLLKGAMPDKYRERYSAQVEGGLTLNVVTGVPDASDDGSDLV
jgi:hypothetical protein